MYEDAKGAITECAEGHFGDALLDIGKGLLTVGEVTCPAIAITVGIAQTPSVRCPLCKFIAGKV